MQRGISIAAGWLSGFLEDLVDREWDSFKRKEYWAHGGEQQRDRQERVADWCAATLPGDLVEIGCYTGGMTVRLAQVARRYGRQVLAIDPWQPGTQDCRGGEYEIFLQNIEPYQDVVHVLRLPSQHETVRSTVKSHDLCFASVDGLHTYEATLQDILNVAHADVIAVDDVLWNTGVRSAFVEGAQRTGKVPMYMVLCREGYLLSDDALGRCLSI
jgi:hypothetical protein